MSFSINPAFSFSLNRILVGSVKFGKYDGIHVCLTAVTSTDKVILHNPYKKLSESNNRLSWAEMSSDIAVLNFNQEIRAIETGCLSSDPKDILVIASPTQLLAYHVDNNRDLFYKEILEGIFIILIGKVCSFENPLVIVGGNQYIRGYDMDGNEKLWIVTSGNVNTLALVDFNNDGKNEIVCGCDNGTIKIYQNDSLLSEFFENSSVIQVSRIDLSSLLAYSLNDGTVGVYNEGIRLWRIKSKSKGLSMSCFDLLGTGSLQLIIGWESGKVDIRDIATGESLFKLSLNQMVISVMQADYRGRGVNDLIICTRNGDVKGYERSKINLQSIKQMDHSELNSLMTTKKNLMLELSQYQSNTKINKEHSENEDLRILASDEFGVIPASTRLQVALSTIASGDKRLHIELSVCTNNDTIIKALIIFSEGIFEGETLIAYSYSRPTSRIVLPFITPKNIVYDIHLKILVGFEHSKQFHVFELTRQLPKFSMYAVIDDFNPSVHLHFPIKIDETTSYVSFKLNERYQRLCLWINQNFLLPIDIEPEHITGLDDIRLSLISVYDKSPVIIWFSDKNESKILTENMDLAGDLIHSLATFLNIEDLKTTACFPNITSRLNQYYERISGFETTYTNLILDVAHKKYIAKNLLIQAEDARLYNENDLTGIYTNLNRLNEDMASSFKIRQQNFVEMQKNLDGVNSVLKSSIRLRGN
ncbi:Bardet-Biedl syndrome 2 protein homolog [Contarinia nasturtii]|uniref:Bardet-Biedl syndrome 2 protein homolog n=1 Tax=Contarinia nasturtii TaxID=265458 RepID=UPI0012D45C0E|nr:Bardet-Biedl syndrome 2 protein homolog [Contarinia nasturtii]